MDGILKRPSKPKHKKGGLVSLEQLQAELENAQAVLAELESWKIMVQENIAAIQRQIEGLENGG